jgi:integrase
MSDSLSLDALRARLSKRGRARDAVWVLDLRHAQFGHLGRLTVRDPSAPGWPHSGKSTTQSAVAERWLKDAYLPWLQRQLAVRRDAASANSGNLDVGEAAEQYLDWLTRRLGADHNTVLNRRSVVTNHLTTIARVLLTALNPAPVRRLLNGLMVIKRTRGGQPTAVPASTRTKGNVRTTLQAIWRYHYPDLGTPFGTVRIEDDSAAIRRRLAAESGDLLLDESPTAYAPEQILEILATAWVYDELILGRPNLRGRTIPNTAGAIALQLGFATRVSELLRMRWSHHVAEHAVARIPGTKTAYSFRWMPVQDSVSPWLQWLRVLGGDPAPTEFILRVDPRAAGAGKKPSKNTFAARIARVLELAGHKHRGRATHVFRATHITWALRNGFSAERLKRFIGHRPQAEKGALGTYVDAALFAKDLRPRDRTYLSELPCPEQVRVRAEELRDSVATRLSMR